MALRAFTIRSRDAATTSDANRYGPPRRGLGSHVGSDEHTATQEDEEQAWHGATGDVRARNATRLRRTRFVRETEGSRQWSGSRAHGTAEIDPEDSSAQSKDAETTDGEQSLSHSVLVNAPACESPVDAGSPIATPPSSSLAQLYAQIAATLPTQAHAESLRSKTALRDAEPALQFPPAKRRRAGDNKRADWFLERVQSQKNKTHHPSTQSQGRSAYASALSGNLPSTTSDALDSREPTSTTEKQPCPTCKLPLPLPCTPDVLHAHLQSIAHRLALVTAPAPAATSSGGTKAEQEATILPRLHLDSGNRGFRLLMDMGWREGYGVGREEWEWLQKEVMEQPDDNAEQRVLNGHNLELDATHRKILPIAQRAAGEGLSEQRDFSIAAEQTVHGSHDETDPDDSVQEPDAKAAAHDSDVWLADIDKDNSMTSKVKQSSNAHSGGNGPPTGLPRRTAPMLVPLSVQLKNDRLGLGRGNDAELRRLQPQRDRRSDSRSMPAAPPAGERSHSSSASRRSTKPGSAPRRRERVKREEEERQRWKELRESLN